MKSCASETYGTTPDERSEYSKADRRSVKSLIVEDMNTVGDAGCGVVKY
jgi:hypothetical protein